MKDIIIGRLFGYSLELRNVPEERAKHIEKLAVAHMNKLNQMYEESLFGQVKSEIELAKAITNPTA